MWKREFWPTVVLLLWLLLAILLAWLVLTFVPGTTYGQGTGPPPGPVRPDAPAGQPGPDRGPEPVPDLDPEPLPNIVLHPGDTITVEDSPPDDATLYLIARGGQCYAVLDCDYNRRDEYQIRAIRLVGARGRELLPVRPQFDPLVLSNVIPPLSLSVSTTGPNPDDPYVYTLTHSHSHNHAPDALPHAHSHAHRGADAHRAGQYGHTRDIHTHEH